MHIAQRACNRFGLWFRAGPSPKIGCTSNVQSGAIPGAPLPLFACRIPATSVPCVQALPPVRAQLPGRLPGISRMFELGRSGWFTATGPSIRPIFTSALPRVRSINSFRCTRSRRAEELSVLAGSRTAGDSVARTEREHIPRRPQGLAIGVLVRCDGSDVKRIYCCNIFFYVDQHSIT